jgi:hypothetical protein
MRTETIRLLTRLACFLPLVAGLFLVDWVSGEVSVMSSAMRGYEPMIGALASGKMIRTSDADSALPAKAAWLMRTSLHPDILVLGSSRVIQISGEWFRPRTLFNAAVLGGDLNDSVSMFQLTVDSGKAPRMVILELGAAFIRGELEPPPPLLTRAMLRYRHFTPALLSSMLRGDAIRWAWSFPRNPGWSLADRPGHFSMRPDGSAYWYAPGHRLTPEQIQGVVNSELATLTPQEMAWRSRSRNDAGDWRLLCRFLDDMQSRGVRVVLFQPPLHPSAYAFYRSRGGYDETDLRREMASRGIPVVGSFSPAALNAEPADFIDSSHVRQEFLHRMLSAAALAGPATALTESVRR